MEGDRRRRNPQIVGTDQQSVFLKVPERLSVLPGYVLRAPENLKRGDELLSPWPDIERYAGRQLARHSERDVQR